MEKCTKCGSLIIIDDTIEEVEDSYEPYGNGHHQNLHTYRADVCADCGHYEIIEPDSFIEE